MQHCHITHFAQWINEYFVCIDFQTALGFAIIQFNKTCVSLFISLQCCYHNDIATVATFSFLRAGRNDGSWDWFSETSIGRIHGRLELVFMPASARGFALFTQQNIGQFRKGLELYYKWYSSVTKTRWKQELVRFSYDEKSANVVMCEDKERKYICSAWNKQQQGACHSSLAKCQPKRINRVRCGNRSFFF